MPEGQRTSQRPQFVGSLSKLTHVCAQRLMPVPEHGTSSHRPNEHRCVDAHARPHAPQFAGSKRGSVHVEPHCVSPSRQFDVTHAPFTHACPVVHALPQRPQWRTSCESCAQSDPQRLKPERHVAGSQRPATHAMPRSQGFPQPPQCSALVRGSKHASPQRTRPAAQLPSSHRPSWHGIANPQVTPQPPQFVRSFVVSTQTSPQSEAPAGHGPDASAVASRTIAPSGRTTGAPHATRAEAHKTHPTMGEAEPDRCVMTAGAHTSATPAPIQSNRATAQNRARAAPPCLPCRQFSHAPARLALTCPTGFEDECRRRGFLAIRSARWCSRRRRS